MDKKVLKTFNYKSNVFLKPLFSFSFPSNKRIENDFKYFSIFKDNLIFKVSNSCIDLSLFNFLWEWNFLQKDGKMKLHFNNVSEKQDTGIGVNFKLFSRYFQNYNLYLNQRIGLSSLLTSLSFVSKRNPENFLCIKNYVLKYSPDPSFICGQYSTKYIDFPFYMQLSYYNELKNKPTLKYFKGARIDFTKRAPKYLFGTVIKPDQHYGLILKKYQDIDANKSTSTQTFWIEFPRKTDNFKISVSLDFSSINNSTRESLFINALECDYNFDKGMISISTGNEGVYAKMKYFYSQNTKISSTTGINFQDSQPFHFNFSISNK